MAKLSDGETPQSGPTSPYRIRQTTHAAVREMRRTFSSAVIAALLMSTGTAAAEVLQLTCRGSVGEDSTDFTIEIDLASSVISEGDLRWRVTGDGVTIDWHFNRRNDELRGVVLTGEDAGMLIAGKCNPSAEDL